LATLPLQFSSSLLGCFGCVESANCAINKCQIAIRTAESRVFLDLRGGESQSFLEASLGLRCTSETTQDCTQFGTCPYTCAGCFDCAEQLPLCRAKVAVQEIAPS